MSRVPGRKGWGGGRQPGSNYDRAVYIHICVYGNVIDSRRRRAERSVDRIIRLGPTAAGERNGSAKFLEKRFFSIDRDAEKK